MDPHGCRVFSGGHRTATTARALVWMGALGAFAAASGARAAELGEKVPAVVADDWSGGEAVDPAQPDGKTVYLVDFFFNDCPPCRETVPLLNRIQERFAKDGLVVVGVNVRDTAAEIERFRRAMDVRYRTARDRAPEDPPGYTQTTHAYHQPKDDDEGINYPSVFLVDREGRLLWRGFPMPSLEDIVARALAGTWTVKEARQMGDAERDWAFGQQNQNPGLMHAAVRTLAALEPGNPMHFIRWMVVADAAGHPEDYDAALDGWYRASRGNADSFIALAERVTGADDFNRRRPRMAAAALMEATKLSTERAPRALPRIAFVYMQLGFREKARATLDLARERAGDDAVLLLNVAQLTAGLGDPEAAVAMLAPLAGEDEDGLAAIHQAFYKTLVEVKANPDQAYTPTTEPLAIPEFPPLRMSPDAGLIPSLAPGAPAPTPES